MSRKLRTTDSSGNYTGLESRKTIHEKGLWHETFICFVYDKSNKLLYLQVKSAHKHSDANVELDFSAGGHIEPDEDARTSLRELDEEIGIKSDECEPVFLGKRQSAADIRNDYKEYEWQYAWLIVVEDRAMESFTLNDEVESLVAIKPQDIIDLVMGTAQAVTVTRFSPRNGYTDIELTTDNFVKNYITGEKIFARLAKAAINYESKGPKKLRW